MRSGWSRALQNHQYSYRNINVFSVGPPGTPPSRPKLISPRILLKSLEFTIISWKPWNLVKLRGILVICWFWESHGAGPSIWPRENQRFVKGHGFVENAGFLEFHVISWNLLISHKNHWIPWIHRNFINLQECCTFAQTCKNSSNSKVFWWSRSPFPAPDLPKPVFWCFLRDFTKIIKFHQIPLNLL